MFSVLLYIQSLQLPNTNTAGSNTNNSSIEHIVNLEVIFNTVCVNLVNNSAGYDSSINNNSVNKSNNNDSSINYKNDLHLEIFTLKLFTMILKTIRVDKTGCGTLKDTFKSGILSHISLMLDKFLLKVIEMQVKSVIAIVLVLAVMLVAQ